MKTLVKFSGFLRIAVLFFAIIPNSKAQTFPNYLPTDGLVAWYPFNGNANDESGNGNDGVVYGATLTEDRDGNPNAAYSFDGVDDFISVVSSPTIGFSDGSFSFSLWLLLNSNSSDVAMLDRPQSGARYNLRSLPGGVPRVFASNSSNQESYADAQFNYMPGDLNHIVAVMSISDNSVVFYINGLEVSNSFEQWEALNPSINPQVNLEIGRYGGGNSYLSGILDDLAIYNRALSAEEVQTLYVGASDFPGCTYADACNYDPGATVDDGTCTYPAPNYDCAGNCLNDDNQNGVCDSEEVYGCTYPDAINYVQLATADDGSCLYTCKGDFNDDAVIDISDLLSFLTAFGNSCTDAGCEDEAACNYDPVALYSDNSCTYPEEFFYCDGTPINDADGDGVPDELEVVGCTDPAADNYNPNATDDDDSCISLSGLQVGDVFGGGLVAYIYQAGDPGFIEGEVHGFVVSDFNLTNNIAWGCSGTFMETSSELGAGMANTIQIVNACSDENFAAKLCYDLIHNGYDDWWLPSRDELAKIYGNRVALDIASALHYWSSTDCSELRARVLNFANGGWFNCSSHTTNRKVLSPYSNGSDAVRRVRAIRYF
ncbi:MAG: hypothetical protein P8N19_12975 [Flavobacteriales bacterium]|nr:hypothetical protein [Flavobacteriales bacterium]